MLEGLSRVDSLGTPIGDRTSCERPEARVDCYLSNSILVVKERHK